MKKKIIDYIQSEIINDVSDFQLSEEDGLLDTGLVDSMGIMKIVSFLEEEFEVGIPPQDITIDNFMNVAAIASYIEGKK